MLTISWKIGNSQGKKIKTNTISVDSYFYKSFTFLFSLDVWENNLQQDKLNKSHFSLIWKRHYYYTEQ